MIEHHFKTLSVLILKEFLKGIQELSNQDILLQVASLFAQERTVGDATLLGLKEIKARRRDAALGYTSLFDMEFEEVKS